MPTFQCTDNHPIFCLYACDLNIYNSLMMIESVLPEQCLKIIQRLYIFIDTKDIDQNKRLQLVVNPQIIKIIINQVENESAAVKMELMRSLSGIFRANNFNSLILAKRDREIMEFNYSILESLITFLLTIKDIKNVEEIVEMVVPFVQSYPINGKIIKSILSVVTKDFYYQKLDHKLLQLSIKLLQAILSHQRYLQSQPNCYFITYGEQSGVRMINKGIKWPFSKGFHIYIKFYMQDRTEDDMVLFNLATQNDEFVIFVTSEGELKIKVFSKEQPLFIDVIPAKQWITMSISYTVKSKLLKNYYEILCSINEEMHERLDLPVPHIGMSDQISQLSIGRNFYGLIHGFIISRSPVILWNKMVLNSWTEIQSFLVINKKNIRELFLFYHPLLNTCISQKEIIYDITSQNHGEVFENTGIYANPFKSVDVNYYGGLYSYLPFLHILKFYQYQKYPKALSDIFRLFYVFFENNFVNVENQAVNCQFFSISSQLINQLDRRFINQEFIEVVERFSQRLVNVLLRRDFLIGFLWRINLRKIQDVGVISGFIEVIEKYYLQYFQWSYGLFSLDDIFHYIIDQFEPQRANQCCFSHFSSNQKGETVDPSKFSSNFTSKTKILKNILKVVFVNLTHFQSMRLINSQILQILFQCYSPCLKLLILESLNQGARAHSKYYIRQFNILNYLYLYLPTTQQPDQLAVIFQILLSCLEEDDGNCLLEQNVISRIAQCLDNIYRQHSQQKIFRSKTDRLNMVRLKNMHRNYSEEKITQEKAKKLQKKLKKGSPIQTHKGLYDSITKLCFYFDKNEEDCLLKHDDYVRILQPYFKICCLNYRKNIINMIRNTVILAAHGKSILQNLTKFDRLYKLLLNQFMLKQLQPDNPDYIPSQQTNDVIRNVYYVIDYMIMGIRSDWGHLYLYLLRLLGLLEETKRDIQKRTSRDMVEIIVANRVTLRKFILRVIKLAERDVQNLSNLVFLVYLMVFSNEKIDEGQCNIFNYFKSFQQLLFIGKHAFISSQAVAHRDQISFIDSKIILETSSSFKLVNIDVRKLPSIKVINFINSYLDVEYTNEESELFKNRSIYLASAEFRVLKPTEGVLRGILAGFLGDKTHQNITIGQVFSIMLGLCIESAITTKNITLLSDSLKQMQLFVVQFCLLSSRDGLKQIEHGNRNIQLPKVVMLNVLHFLYEMIEANPEKNIRNLLEDSLYYIFYFIGLLANSLSDKLGRPQTRQSCLQLSKIQRQVEQYNYFTFEIWKQIASLKDIIQIPNIDKEKAISIITNKAYSNYFRSIPVKTMENKVQHTTNTHKVNTLAVKKQIQERFNNSFQHPSISKEHLLNHQNFKKAFLFDHLKANNLNYRKTQRIWRKIWKRLRVYHYFWSVGMNQRQTPNLEFRKNYTPPFRHKFSKFLDLNGVRSILQIQPVQPWHVKKVLMQKEFQYRSSNYLFSLHHEQLQVKQLSVLQKLLSKNSEKGMSFYVDWIKNNSKRKGYLSIEQEKLKFRYVSTFQKDSHLQFASFVLADYKPIEKFWPLVEIVNVIDRRYLTLKQCLLIEFEDSTSLIFNFPNADKQQFLQSLQAKQAEKTDKQSLLRLNKVIFYTQRFNYSCSAVLEQATSQWKAYKISNFRYLNLLNKYSGRSHLDPANYPIFPWIIASFDNGPIKYRDLSKTVGALGNEQLVQHYRSKTEAVDPFDPVPPYQFGTHYSSPGVVFNFLIRLQPYTQAGRTLQGGKFDLSDRLFNSLRICWQSITSQVSDVRQLVPQFFYLPQFLLNIQHHNFGLTQMKQRVHNVILPGWSEDAYHFITVHREELESVSVSLHLQEWIDLIFGYKQKGKIAEENLNLFYYLTYEDSIDLSTVEDEQIRISKQAQIMHFGQTPSQLFHKKHPTRSKAPSSNLKNYKKVKLLFCIDDCSDLSFLCYKQGKLTIFNDYIIRTYEENKIWSRGMECKLLRDNSKENVYFLEDLNWRNRVAVFGGGLFVAIASYVNGDLVVYNLGLGKKVEEKKGTPRTCLMINSEQNLLFSGSKNGLLEVFQIVYGEKDSVTLILIASEYYPAPIYSVSSGANFYAVSSGNIVAIVKISRSLAYVHDKIKMRGIKMIRSFEASRNVQGALLCSQPLSCVVFYNTLEMNCYSINGQLLKTRQLELSVSPQTIRGQNFSDLIAVIQGGKLIFLSTPFLEVVRMINLPNKLYKQMKFFDDKCFLGTNQGQVLCLIADAESQVSE